MSNLLDIWTSFYLEIYSLIPILQWIDFNFCIFLDHTAIFGRKKLYFLHIDIKLSLIFQKVLKFGQWIDHAYTSEFFLTFLTQRRSHRCRFRMESFYDLHNLENWKLPLLPQYFKFSLVLKET